MKYPAILGACVMVVLFVTEGLLMMSGYLTLDEHSTTGPIAGKTYIPFPNWVYIVLPVATGLAVFLFYWAKSLKPRGRLCVCAEHQCTV